MQPTYVPKLYQNVPSLFSCFYEARPYQDLCNLWVRQTVARERVTWLYVI